MPLSPLLLLALVVKEEGYLNTLNDLTVTAWEGLSAWPEARDSLVRTLMVHGALVSTDASGTTIVKKEKEEWILPLLESDRVGVSLNILVMFVTEEISQFVIDWLNAEACRKISCKRVTPLVFQLLIS